MGDEHIAEQSVDSEWHSFRDQGGDTFFLYFLRKIINKWGRRAVLRKFH